MKTKPTIVFSILLAASMFAFLKFSSNTRETEQASSESASAEVESPEPFVPLRTEPADSVSDEPDHPANDRKPTYVQLHRPELTSKSFAESMTAFLDLVRYLTENPEDFDEVLAAFKADPALALKVAMFADAVAHELENNAGRRLLLETAHHVLREERDPENRNYALAALSKFRPDGAETIDLVARASREGSFNETHTATFALASWLNDPDSRERATDELIRTAQTSADAELRSYAVGALLDGHDELPAPVLQAVNDYFSSNPPPEHRLAVASALATAGDDVRPVAIEQLQTAYLETPNIELRRSVLEALAIYGGREAVAWAHQYPEINGILAQDLSDYLGILERGITDPNEILEIKEEIETERTLRRYSEGR